MAARMVEDSGLGDRGRHLQDWEASVERAERVSFRLMVAAGLLVVVFGALLASPVGTDNQALVLYGFEASLLGSLGLGLALVFRAFPGGPVVSSEQRTIGGERRGRSISSGRRAGD